jgi:hypothetical protein
MRWHPARSPDPDVNGELKRTWNLRVLYFENPELGRSRVSVTRRAWNEATDVAVEAYLLHEGKSWRGGLPHLVVGRSVEVVRRQGGEVPLDCGSPGMRSPTIREAQFGTSQVG